MSETGDLADKPPETPVRRRRFLRSFAVGVSIQILILGGFSWLIFVSIPKAMERAAITELARLGIQSVELSVAAIESEQVIVEAIQIGADGDLALSRLKVLFDWRDLLAGRIERMTLDGLLFRLEHQGDRLTFGALDPLFRGMQDGASAEVDYEPERWPV